MGSACLREVSISGGSIVLGFQLKKLSHPVGNLRYLTSFTIWKIATGMYQPKVQTKCAQLDFPTTGISVLFLCKSKVSKR